MPKPKKTKAPLKTALDAALARCRDLYDTQPASSPPIIDPPPSDHPELVQAVGALTLPGNRGSGGDQSACSQYMNTDPSTAQTEGTLDGFITGLIKAKGLDYLSPPILEQMRNDLLTRIEDRLNMVIVNNMPDSQMRAFNQLLDTSANDEQIQAFCERAIPNIKELTAIPLAQFQETYLGKIR